MFVTLISEDKGLDAGSAAPKWMRGKPGRGESGAEYSIISACEEKKTRKRDRSSFWPSEGMGEKHGPKNSLNKQKQRHTHTHE